MQITTPLFFKNIILEIKIENDINIISIKWYLSKLIIIR